MMFLMIINSNNIIESERNWQIGQIIIIIVGYLGIFLAMIKGIGFFITNSRNDIIIYFKKNVHIILLLLLVLWIWISSFASGDLTFALFGSIYRNEGALVITSYIGYFACGYLLNKRDNSLKFLLILMIFVGTFLSFSTIIQSFNINIPYFAYHINKLYFSYSAIYLNSNHFAYYLVIQIAILLVLLHNIKKFKNYFFILLLFAINSYTLIINNTFGSYLAIIAILIFSTIAQKLRKNTNRLRLVVPIFIFLFLSMIEMFSNRTYITSLENFLQLFDDIINIFNNNTSSNEAGTGRWGLWKATIDVFLQNPIFGTGPDGLGDYLLPVGDVDRPHNEFLQYLSFYGIFGFIFYFISIIIICFRNLINIKSLDLYSYLSLVVVLGYLVSSFFGNTMYYTLPYFIIFLGLSSCYNKEL